MLNRPHSFEDIIGHDVFKRYFKDRIAKGTMPQFIILEGPEGLGKTSMAEVIAIELNYGPESTPEKEKAILEVIDKRQSNDCIKKFNMAKDSGKDTAKEVLAELSSVMSSTGKKVVICDESHAIKEDAQDVFLVETESLKKNVYLIMCTTDKTRLKATLLSRAACIPLTHLKTSEMIQVLGREVKARNLNIQGGEETLRMIAEWADNKPRAALNILNAFGENEVVTTEVVREFIGYMNMEDVLPLVSSLSESMTYGLSYINDMQLSPSLLDRLVECLRIKMGQSSYKMSIEDYRKVKTALERVPEENIIMFIHKIASLPKLTKSGLISAFVSSHTAFERLFKRSGEVFNDELATKIENMDITKITTPQNEVKAPTLDQLLSGSQILGGT